MMMEFERFLEFGDEWFRHSPRRREDLITKPILIDPRYIYWVYPYPITDQWEFSDVRLANREKPIVICKSYEEMKAIVAKKSLWTTILGH